MVAGRVTPTHGSKHNRIGEVEELSQARVQHCESPSPTFRPARDCTTRGTVVRSSPRRRWAILSPRRRDGRAWADPSWWPAAGTFRDGHVSLYGYRWFDGVVGGAPRGDESQSASSRRHPAELDRGRWRCCLLDWR